jgi:tRNA (guanosine-2'-O-)-methyltransferase
MTQDRQNQSTTDSPSLVEYLSSFVTPQRLDRMHQVLNQRTRYLTVVLEDIYQPHNASAVLRSCDAFGIQDVHIIEDKNAYRVNPDVELGTSQWLTMNRYRATSGSKHHDPKNQSPTNPIPTAKAIQQLKDMGYRIVATSPDPQGYSLRDFPLDPGPIALFFGTELSGLSDYVLEHADTYVAIPMHGFVESFNISVSAALCMYDLSTRLRSSALPWQLSFEEQQEILLQWLRRSIKRADALEREFHLNYKPN